MDRRALAVVIFALGTICFAFVVGGNLYEQVVCVPSWRAPGGLEAWRTFTGDHHAGYFFLSLAPAALILLAVGTALGWSRMPARNPYALFATVAVLAMLVFTLVYFLPRNRLLFVPATATSDAAEAAAVLKEWIVGNYVRLAVAISGL